jgi:hypothetical protein
MWMSSRGQVGKHKRLKNTKTFAIDENNSARFVGADDFLVRTEIPKPKRASNNKPHRISMIANLTESIEGVELDLVKSAVLMKRKSDNL